MDLYLLHPLTLGTAFVDTVPPYLRFQSSTLKPGRFTSFLLYMAYFILFFYPANLSKLSTFSYSAGTDYSWGLRQQGWAGWRSSEGGWSGTVKSGSAFRAPMQGPASWHSNMDPYVLCGYSIQSIQLFQSNQFYITSGHSAALLPLTRPTRELERDLLQEHIVAGQWIMTSYWKKVGLS